MTRYRTRFEYNCARGSLPGLVLRQRDVESRGGGRGRQCGSIGRIVDTDGQPVAGCKIDVWQAKDGDFYDVQQKGIQPDFNLRGVFRTGADGTYSFRAVKPKFYPIPDDGPVGKLLVALGRHPFRPAHFHYILEADGYESLTPHIFDPYDPFIHSDAVFGVKESLMAKFELIEEPAAIAEAGFDGPFYLVEHDFVLTKV